ncbi:MAG: hypothetical protein AAGC88_08255 [Bacteroidota bacterium]
MILPIDRLRGVVSKSSLKVLMGLMLMPLFFLTYSAAAHTVVLSDHRIAYQEEGWVLTFKQKTSQLRDIVYELNPNLKGKNLNSQEFLDETARLISRDFRLVSNDNSLSLMPLRMQYDGLRFEGRFLIDGLPENPDYVTIETYGFDSHDHSVKSLSIYLNDQGYVHYFNSNQTLAAFSFSDRTYLDVGELPKHDKTNLIYVGLVIFVLCLAVFLFQFVRTKAMKEA